MKTHIIHWKCNTNGIMGTGTKAFEKEEAEHLATELNETYPDIVHEAVPLVLLVPAPAVAEAA